MFFFFALAVLLLVKSVEVMGDSRRHGLAFLVGSLVFLSFLFTSFCHSFVVCSVTTV